MPSMSALMATSLGDTVATEVLPCQPNVHQAHSAHWARCTGNSTCAQMGRTATRQSLTTVPSARLVTLARSAVGKVGTFIGCSSVQTPSVDLVHCESGSFLLNKICSAGLGDMWNRFN